MITNIDQLKDMVAFMRSHGVGEFTIEGVTVKFDMAAAAAPVLLSTPDQSATEQLNNIKTTLQALKNEADADELWSV